MSEVPHVQRCHGCSFIVPNAYDHMVLYEQIMAYIAIGAGNVLRPILFLLYSSEFFSILENNLIGYADDSTLIAVVPKVYISTGIPTRVVGTCFCGEAREAESNLPT